MTLGITATVVDIAGAPQVVLRADHATVHTKYSSYPKAYTVVTMGPTFHVDTTGEWVKLVSKYPPLAAEALANTPNGERKNSGRSGCQRKLR
jgi:uncharacterized protein GlcG (DUF336 family)